MVSNLFFCSFFVLSLASIALATSGYLGSDLSNVGDQGRHFDLVVGVTQKSVSETMRKYLSNIDRPPFKQLFVYNGTSTGHEPSFVPIDYETAKGKLGFDPFTIPDGTLSTDSRVKALIDNRISLGFMAEFGNPAVSASRLPEPLTFDRSGSEVTYNMVMKEFKAFELAGGVFGPVQLKMISQTAFLAKDPANEPWYFKFSVDLDMRNDSARNQFHLLPPTTQQLVKNLGVDIFSIQQLFLNLNTAQLQNNLPAIPNLDSTSYLAILLQRVFLGAYLKTIDASGNGVLLGYTVTTNNPPSREASLIPTDLNIHISSYKNPDGSDTTKFPLYTLNYLVASENRRLPSPVDFGWNWIDEAESNKFDGVVAVRRDVFRDFLQDTLSPELRNICLIPDVDVRINDPIKAHFSWSVKKCATAPVYTVLDGSSDGKVLSYSAHRSDYDKDVFPFPPVWGSIAMDVYSNSDVFFTGNLIKTVSTLRVHAKVNILGGVTSGNVIFYRTTTNYELGVDAGGRITVKLQGGKAHFEDMSSDIDANGWSKFVSAGTVNNLINTLVSSVQGFKRFLTGFDGAIFRRLNSGADWVFPGGNTFSFKDVRFSNHLDLVSHIKYNEPVDSRR